VRSEADLLDIGNFGAKSIDEVKEKLARYGPSVRADKSIRAGQRRDWTTSLSRSEGSS
jgi:DNA-directed RNA polymerase alpha subunit